MKFLDNMIMNWARTIHRKRTKLQRNKLGAISLDDDIVALQTSAPEFHGHRPMKFNLHQASGGWVVEYTCVNPNSLDCEQKLHIITSQEDLGTALAQIITMEQLIK